MESYDCLEILETVVIIDESDEEKIDDDLMPQLVDERTHNPTFSEHLFAPLPKIVDVHSAADNEDLFELLNNDRQESVIERSESGQTATLPTKDALNGDAASSNSDSSGGAAVNESLSVSTTNKPDSLQVNVRYERKLCISRKKCTGVHQKRDGEVKEVSKKTPNNKEGASEDAVEEPVRDDAASQMAYYQKLLEIRSRSSGNNNKLSITITSDNNNETSVAATTTDDDSDFEDDDDCVLVDCTFSCSLCSFTTDKQKTLKEHERNHRRTNHAVLKCAYCDQKYTKYALYTHVQNVHPGQKFYISEEISLEKEEKGGQCSLCSYSSSRRDLMKHRKCHENNQPILPCDKCDYQSTIRALRMHQRVHTTTKPSSEEATRKSVRERCARREEPPELLSAYDVERKEKPKPRVKCVECNFYAGSADELAEHLRKHPILKVIEGNAGLPKMHICSQCSYGSVVYRNVVRHEKTHEHDSTEKCQNCEYRSTTNALRKHKKLCKQAPPVFKTKAKSFQCVECPYATNLRIKLNIHSKKKHPKRVEVAPPAASVSEAKEALQCPQCDHTSNNPYHLEQHMKGHRSNMPNFKCSSCEFTGNMFGLRRHFLKTGHSLEGRTPAEPPRLTAAVKKAESGVEPGAPAPPMPQNSPPLLPPQLELAIESPAKDAKNPWKCPRCSYQAKTKDRVAHHMRLHNGHTPFVECACGFKSVAECVKYHQRRCAVYDLTKAVGEPTLLEGGQTPQRESGYLTRRRSAALAIDVANETLAAPPEQPLFQCRLCSAAIALKSNFDKHVANHPPPDKLKKCVRCDFKSTPFMLRKHIDQGIHAPQPSLALPRRRSTAVENDKPKKPAQERASTKKTRSAAESGKTQENVGGQKSAAANKRAALESKTAKKRPSSSNQTPKTVAEKRPALETEKGKFACPICFVTYTFEMYLELHLRAHRDSPNLKSCPICGVKSTQKAMKLHAQLVHPDGDARTTPSTNSVSPNFRCEACPFSTPLRIKLNVHKRKRHPSTDDDATAAAKRAKLDNPPEKQPTHPTEQQQQSSPKRTGDPPEKEPTKSLEQQQLKSTKCSLCSYSSSRAYDVLRHVKSHESNPTWQCQHCHVKGTKRLLRGHHKRCPKYATGEEWRPPQKVPLSCSKCSFTTYIPVDLRLHESNCTTEVKVIKNMNAVKSFKCEHCSFTSFWQYVMDRHKHSHEVLKLPVEQCPHCEFRSTPTALSAHLRKCNPAS